MVRKRMRPSQRMRRVLARVGVAKMRGGVRGGDGSGEVAVEEELCGCRPVGADVGGDGVEERGEDAGCVEEGN